MLISWRLLSNNAACLVEFQPRAARKQLFWIAVTETADEIRFDPAAGEKLAVDCGIVEARHGAAIESQGARGQHEVGGLQRTVAKGRSLCDFLPARPVK